MKNNIYPCLGIKGKIAEAAAYYIHTFGDGKINHQNEIVLDLELSGQRFMLLNDGPSDKPNPAISFTVISEDSGETEKYWNALLEGGQVLMPLDSYDWSPKYGWIQDKYDVSWQLYTGDKNSHSQKFCPSLMFVGKNTGRAAEAIQLYTDLFPQSSILGVMNYTEADKEQPDLIKYAQFVINDVVVTAMDSSLNHPFNFVDGVSLIAVCDTQEEIDTYWERLTANGGREVACGWLVDSFGVSWQITPKIITELVYDAERFPRVMQAVMRMKKLIIADLENA